MNNDFHKGIVFENLTSLNLSMNFLKKFPNPFGSLGSLKILDLSSNAIEELTITSGFFSDIQLFFSTFRKILC